MAQYSGEFSIIEDTLLKQIEEAIAQNEMIIDKIIAYEYTIVGAYALAVLGFAQKYSAGPLDPRAKNPALAWLLPVRRISSAYYLGWYAERLGAGAWRVSNRSREAYFIEFGINHPSTGKTDSAGNRNRIRRPVLKMSVMDAIEFFDGMETMSKLIGESWSFSSAGSPALVGGEVYGEGAIAVTPIVAGQQALSM